MAIDLITLQKKVLQLRIDGQYKKTIEACSELLERGRKEKDDKSIFTALINKAAAYYNIGEIEESFLCIDQHLEYCVDHGDEADWLNGYNILFLLHEHNKDYVKAKETLHQAIRLGLSLHKFNIVSNAYSNFSSILASEESFKEALKYAEKGLEMAKRHEPNTPILEFRVKLNIANALIGLNLMEEASSLVEALRMDTLLTTHIREKTQVHDLYSRFLIKEKRFTEAYDALTTTKLNEGFAFRC